MWNVDNVHCGQNKFPRRTRTVEIFSVKHDYHGLACEELLLLFPSYKLSKIKFISGIYNRCRFLC